MASGGLALAESEDESRSALNRLGAMGRLLSCWVSHHSPSTLALLGLKQFQSYKRGLSLLTSSHQRSPSC